MKRKICLALCVLFGAVFVASSVGLGVVLYRYQQADEAYEDLRDRFVMENVRYTGPASSQSASRPDPGTDQTQTEQATAGKTEQNPATGIESDRRPETENNPPQISQEPEKPPENQPEKKPLPDYAPIRVNFSALLEVNEDVIGWLYCEGTPIHYPVVQSHDNDDYLHADLYGNYLYSGTLFADCRSGAIGTDQNHIIYGHTMKNGSMFGTMRNYKKQSYYDAHPFLFYLTPDQDYRIDLFAGIITEAASEYYYPNFQGADGFAAVLKKIQSKSTFSSDVTVTENDRIVMLSSCDYEFNNARYVIFGKLTPISS